MTKGRERQGRWGERAAIVSIIAGGLLIMGSLFSAARWARERVVGDAIHDSLEVHVHHDHGRP